MTKTTTKRGRPKKTATPAPAPTPAPVAPNPELGKLGAQYEGAVAEGTPAPDQGPGTPAAPEAPKKRGRPPGSKSSAVSEYLAMRPMVKAVIAFPYAMAANRYGDHWRLSDEEAEGMVDPHLAVINKYLPAYIKEHQELYAIAILHGVAIMVRMTVQARINASTSTAVPENNGVSSGPGPGEARQREILSSPRPSPAGT